MMNDELKTETDGRGEIVIYQSAEGLPDLEVRLEQETVWLNQKQMAALFNTERSVITKHLRNIFISGELDEKSNVHFLHIAKSDKPVAFFNLDAILSVGYRVNSKRGTQFRIWATQVLRDHLIKGYSANSKRLEELQQSLKLVGRYHTDDCGKQSEPKGHSDQGGRESDQRRAVTDGCDVKCYVRQKA